ncbi:hypothetical protein F0562_010085 [Nyssa sinensis]|uniref:Uncharacterized protein n=1 Tax=Nyssa sinensis TaxID=561372 RepID=A0A5J5A1K9_9ASTE|nr:hypothetical protein F0562_010085 [Nyssa sinensis]
MAQEMEASSIVSRARTAFHSAAAKAERVFTDIKKSDLATDRGSDKQSPNASQPESPELMTASQRVILKASV